MAASEQMGVRAKEGFRSEESGVVLAICLARLTVSPSTGGGKTLNLGVIVHRSDRSLSKVAVSCAMALVPGLV